MHAEVIKYYRKLLKDGFTHAGTLESPSIVLDTVGAKINICGQSYNNFMLVYIGLSGEMISDIKYLCICDPTANVVVEILCTLIKGKTLADGLSLSAEDLFGIIGSVDDEFLAKAKGIIALLHQGIVRYQSDPIHC